MQWFVDWWNAMNLLQQSFAVVAIPATVVLILQTVLLLFGVGGHAADHGEIADSHDGLDGQGGGHDIQSGDCDVDGQDHDLHDPAH